jgi:hypothetical protein
MKWRARLTGYVEYIYERYETHARFYSGDLQETTWGNMGLYRGKMLKLIK